MKNQRTQSTLIDSQGALIVSSDDGAVSYRLIRTRFGLCVERARQHQHGNARLVHTANFGDTDRFLKWCDSDSVRFDYPIVSSTIRREGGTLLERHEHSTKTFGDHEDR